MRVCRRLCVIGGSYEWITEFMRNLGNLCVSFLVYAFLQWKKRTPRLWESAFHLESEGFSLDGEGADDVGD